jgi:hypothetical protein
MRIKGACIRRLLKFSDPVRRWRRNPAVRLQLVVFRHLQRVDAAQRLGIAVEYRDIGAHAARLLHCIQKRSRCSSSRLSPSRLVYSQPLFVEIRSDWRRRTVEKPAR